MKRLLLLVVPMMAIAASAQENMRVVGTIKQIDFDPNVVLTVKTKLGEEQVYLGQPNDWRGISNFLDLRDTISVYGRKDPSTSWIIAERMWLNGSHFTLPKQSLSIPSGSITTQGNIRAALSPTREVVSEVVSAWMDEPRKAANHMIDKYGVPDELTRTSLTWHNNGPWKKTIVTNEEIRHTVPMDHHDMITQVVKYKVPADRLDDIAAFNSNIIVDKTKGEISARCGSEAANYLAINLADDVADGDKSATQASEFYADTIRAMNAGTMNSEQRDYTSKFMF